MFIKQAHYKYSESGALVRTELAENLQGIDYVYNLNGQLKAINHPSILPGNDPGNDGNNGFLADVFGMGIDYYTGDYTRTGTPKPITGSSSGTNQFNGNIKSTRWNTQVGSATQKAYMYGYNKNSWLNQATYGTANSAGIITAHASGDYKMSGITYDANGNIQTLERKGYTDVDGTNTMDNFVYNYSAGDKGNRLDYIKDSSDNPDTSRYADLKDQEQLITVSGSTPPVGSANYIYNDLGQLVMDYQENLAYEYNASGLVTRINKLSSVASGTFYSIDFQNFNASLRAKREWIDTDTGLSSFNFIYYDQAMNCTALTDIYGNLLEMTGKGSKVKNFRVNPGSLYKLDMDIVVDRKLYYQLTPDPWTPAPEIPVEAWVVVNVK